MLKIISKLRSRKVLYLMPLAILSAILVPVKLLLLGVVIYFVFFRLHTLMYHEFQVHKFIKPKNQLIELVGYFIIAAYEWQSPENKIKFHQLHHDNYKSLDADPTEAKLRLANNFFLYCLDLTPHAAIVSTEVSLDAIETSMYCWFNKYWEIVTFVTVGSWLVFLPFWSFLAFYSFPLFIWSIIYRTTDWTCHKINLPDYNLSCLYLGTSAYHGRHHNNDTYDRATYYGLGFWKYVNIDYWITAVFFDDYPVSTLATPPN
jgi:hypothetical protein